MKICPTIITQQNVLLKVVANETFNEEESFTFQSVVFDKESKKLIVERGVQKIKKGKSPSKFDLKDMHPSQISKIHRPIGDSLEFSWWYKRRKY
jgi:hypothetical protein